MEFVSRPANFSRAHGFTLLEVLVIVAVLSISAAVLIPNLFPDQRQALHREAQRLADAMQHAALAAQWRGENLAWSADGDGYRFWRQETSSGQGADAAHPGWRTLDDDDVLSPHRLPLSVGQRRAPP